MIQMIVGAGIMLVGVLIGNALNHGSNAKKEDQ